jgi:hypothetical protein
MLQLLVTANFVHGLLIFCTLMIEAIRSTEASILRTATQSYIAHVGILHCHRPGDVKSYNLDYFANDFCSQSLMARDDLPLPSAHIIHTVKLFLTKH